MSLIADALRRAQEGAARRLPPLAGGRSPFPGLGPRADGRRWRALAVALVAVGVAGIALWAGLSFTRRTGSAPTTPPLVVVTPVPPAPETATPPPEAAASPVPEPARTPPPPPAPTAARRPPVRAPLASTVPVAPLLRGPFSPVPSTPATVEVRVFEVTEAQEALAAGLDAHQQGNLANAIEEYRRGIASDARNPGLYNNLGIVLRQTGNLEEAAQAFEGALKIDLKYEKALNNLGVTRYQQGRFEDAIDLFKQAIRINASNAESYVNLGIIYLQAGRSDEAVGALQDALRYDPRSAEAHYNLALLWERRGDRDRALQHYERFLELAGSGHEALVARVKDHLGQLQRRR